VELAIEQQSLYSDRPHIMSAVQTPELLGDSSAQEMKV